LFRWFFDLTRFWLYIIIFFALMAVCSYGVVSHYVRGVELETPALAGLTVDEALQKLGQEPLKKYRLSLMRERSQPHESARKGEIISQQPEPKSRIKAGSPIKVVLSDGPPLVTVPELIGQSRDRAATMLRRYNLKLGNEAFLNVPGKPGGLVITSDPPGKTGVVEGSQVNLLLTAGASQSNEMPDLIGFTLDEVRETLKNRGLPEAEPVPRPAGGDAVPGQVVDQMPKPGDLMQPGTHIIVYYEPPRAEPTAPPEGSMEEERAVSPEQIGETAPAEGAPEKPAAESEDAKPPEDATPQPALPSPGEGDSMPLPQPAPAGN
jgi:serine/threonine-protein kinase